MFKKIKKKKVAEVANLPLKLQREVFPVSWKIEK
jgi:hypothetical protein